MATNSLPGYATTRSNSMVPGQKYKIWRHDLPESEWFDVELLTRPSCLIRDMNKDDAFVFSVLDKNGAKTDEKIKLVRNNGFPHFLIVNVPGRRGNALVQRRITIVEKINK